MPRVMFQLSMPSNNSWNGKWTGQDNVYTVARPMTDKKFGSLKEYYSYAFGDGWVAAVTVRKCKPREKATNKFCGYTWMINSILTHGEIKVDKASAREAE